MFFGTFFLAIGIFLLLGALGIITATIWKFFWAILFIVIGIKILFRRKDCCGGFMNHRFMHSGCDCGQHKPGKEGSAEKGEYKENNE